MENNTWIKLFRKFKEWEWYKDSNVSRLFIHLLLSVNYEDKKWQGIEIKRGDIVIGIEDFGIQIGLTRQQTRSALNKLKSTNEITIKTTNKFTVVTINKFNDYQQITNKSTNEQPTNNQQITTTKEYKNKRNKEIESNVGFESLEFANKYLTKWNEVFGTQYSATRQIVKPLTEWLKDHPIDKILEAIGNIKNDPYWKNENVEPIWLLRFKDPKGEPIDRIEKFYNTKPVVKWQTHL